MVSQVIDYERVIQDIERKRARINAEFDAAIATIRRVLVLQDVGEPVLPGVPTHTSSPSASDGSYKGMSVINAALMHIRAVGHAVPNMVLAKELETGGYEHQSKNFPNTLNSILWRRAKTTGDIRKSERGWEIVPAKAVQQRPWAT